MTAPRPKAPAVGRHHRATPDCDAFGHIGPGHCDYCGQPMTDPDSRAVLLAAARLRRGDAWGALRLLQATP